MSYSAVILSDGNIVKRHVDNIKARYNASTNATNGSEFDSAFQSGPEPTEDTQHSIIPDHPSTSNETTETTTEPSARPLRIRRPPARYNEFVVTDEASELGEEEM